MELKEEEILSYPTITTTLARQTGRGLSTYIAIVTNIKTLKSVYEVRSKGDVVYSGTNLSKALSTYNNIQA